MVRTPSPLAILRSICLPAVLALLGAAGCVDHNPPGTTLFVFDGASSSVKVWADVNKVFDAFNPPGATVPAPDRTISSANVIGSITLAWGGMVVDSIKNRLYLVSQGGTVYAITKADTQNGDISAAQDILSFTLGNAADHFPSGYFGQAALDQGADTLYVQETSQDGTQTHLWYVSNISSPFSQVTGLAATFTANGDQLGAGLAAQGGKVYALFGSGNVILDNHQAQVSGPRLRMGVAPAFAINANVLIGAATKLVSPVSYGSLAFDSQNSALFVFAQTSSPAVPAVLVFNQSQFTLNGLDQAPARGTLGDDPLNLANLRIIAHPTDSDWLVGADMAGTPGPTGTGLDVLRIWKNPSGGGAAVFGHLTGASEIRALAIGGTN